MSKADTSASKALRRIATGLDYELEQAAGKRMGFCLIVFSDDNDGQSSYISNANRQEVIKGMKDLLARWGDGMTDIPAHEKH